MPSGSAGSRGAQKSALAGVLYDKVGDGASSQLWFEVAGIMHGLQACWGLQHNDATQVTTNMW